MAVAISLWLRCALYCGFIGLGDTQTSGSYGYPSYGQQYHYAGQQYNSGIPQYHYGYTYSQPQAQPRMQYAYPGVQPQQHHASQFAYHQQSQPQYVYTQPQYGYYQQPQAQPQQYWQQQYWYAQQPQGGQPQQGQQARPTMFTSEQLRGQPSPAPGAWAPTPPPSQASPPAPPPQASPSPAPTASPAPPPPARKYRRRAYDDVEPMPGRMPVNRAQHNAKVVEVYCGSLKGGFARACSECPPQGKRNSPAGKEWCRGDCKWDGVRNTCGDDLLGL